MSNIIISRTPAKNVTLLTDNIREALELSLEENKPSDIIISTSGENVFDDAKLAIEKQIKVIVNDTLTKPSELKTVFKKNLFLFTIATAPTQTQEIKDRLVKASLRLVPQKMKIEELVSVLTNAANGTVSKISVIEAIQEEHKERVLNIRNMVSIAHDDSLIHVNKDEDILEFIKNNPGVHFNTSDLGTGKTEILKELFEHECNVGNFPIFVNSSRALSSSMTEENDPRFYMNAVKGHFDIKTGRKIVDIQKGIIGVTNTVFLSNDLQEQRGLCKTLLIDESEDVLDHSVGEAVNKGNLQDKINMDDRLESLFIGANNIVLSDGMPSMNTVEKIKKIAFNLVDKEVDKEVAKTIVNDNGEFDTVYVTEKVIIKEKVAMPIYVHYRESEYKKPLIRLMSKDMAMNEAKEKIVAGEKVAIFNDASHNEKESVVNATIEALSPFIKGNYSLVDGNFMSDKKKSLEMHNPNAFAAKNDVIFYNTAAKCGLSITDQDYKSVVALGHQTTSPTGLIQSFKRARPVETVDLYVDRTMRKMPLTELAILNSIMYSELMPTDITKEKQDEMWNDPKVMSVLKRMTHKNNMKDDYINTLLIMLDVLGYEVEMVEKDADKAKSGKDARKAGTEAEREIRVANVIAANKITEKEAKNLKDTSEFNSQENKNKLQSYNLRDFYNVEDVTEELMDFDNSGKGMACINNMDIARNKLEQSKNTSKFIKSEMIKKFFELTELDVNTFGSYSNVQSEAFQEFIFNESLKINDKHSITAKEAFEIAFPDCNLNKRSMSTVSSILTVMFKLDKPTKGGRSKGKTMYIAQPNEKAEMYYDNIFNENKSIKIA